MDCQESEYNNQESKAKAKENGFIYIFICHLLSSSHFLLLLFRY